MKKLNVFRLVTLVLFSTACASIPVTKVSVQSFEMHKQNLTPTAAIAQMIGVLVDQGFDVKMSNPDSGIVTTEYKKFASVSTDPPFDYYMQIRTRIKVIKGVATVQITPAIREQNRMNSGAFSEHELVYFTGEPTDVEEIESMKSNGGWRARSQTVFTNVVTSVADALGISPDDIIQNVSKTTFNARDIED